MYIELGKKFFQNFFNNPSLKIQTRLFFQNKITNYNEKTLRLSPNNIEGLNDRILLTLFQISKNEIKKKKN